MFEALGAGERVATADPLAATSHLMRRLCPHDQHLAPGAAALDFVHQEADLGTSSLHLLSYGAEVTVHNEGHADFYLLQVTLDGACDIATPEWRLDLGPGMFFVMNPGLRYRKIWSASSRQLMVKLPRALFATAGGGTPVFAQRPHRADAEGRPLMRFLDYLCRDLRAGEGAGCDAAVRALHERSLAALLTASLPHRIVPALPAPAVMSSPAVPAHLARAERYLREHCAQAVSLDDAAEQAGISPRTLRDAFRQFRNTTPGAYLLRLRLARARAALLSGQGGTVTEIALAAGFAHLGRFAQTYARAYGEAPSATLRAGRAAARRP